MREWDNFYVAVAGASATLTGLIFVGVSISLTKILSIRGLPERALLSLILLLNTLVMSLLFLAPMPLNILAILVLIISVVTWLIVFRSDIHIFKNKQKEYKKQYLFNILTDPVATILFIVAGLALMANGPIDGYWMVPAIIVSLIKAVIDGWVLLVEINR